MHNPITALILSLLVVSCVNVVRVKKNTGTEDKPKFEQIGGIPFYAKTEKVPQTTIYIRTWIKAVLEVTQGFQPKTGSPRADSNVHTVSYEIRITKDRLAELDAVKSAILEAKERDLQDALDAILAFLKIDPIRDDASITEQLVKNDTQSIWVVDRHQQYFLNAPLPWFGSGNLTQTLNQDGTLAEATSAPDTKLAEGISALVPFKEYLTGKYVADASNKSSAVQTEVKTMFMELNPDTNGMNYQQFLQQSELVTALSLKVEEEGYQYVFTRILPPDDTEVEPIDFNIGMTSKIPFERKALEAEMKPEAKKDDSKKVNVSGTLTFPKEWGK